MARTYQTLAAAPVTAVTAYLAQGQLAAAEAVARGHVGQVPGDAAGWWLLSMVAAQAGRADLADRMVRVALALDPAHGGGWRHYGLSIPQTQQPAAFRRAVTADPRNPGAWSDLGIASLDADPATAATSFWRAIVLAPGQAAILTLVGVATFEHDRESAINWYRRATHANPTQATAQYNLGDGLGRTNDLQGAILAFRRALAADPAMANAWHGLAVRWRDGARPEAALAAQGRVVALRPTDPRGWRDLSFQALGTAQEAEAAARFAALWPTRPRPRPRDANPDRRLTVGLVSPDFRAHVVASFLRPYLDHRDRQAIRLVAYAEIGAPDAIGQAMLAKCDAVRITTGRPTVAIAEEIAEDGVDVLVDLAGHSEGNRLDVFAQRPAPVQASWLGYNGPTGLPAIDWRLSDPWLDPKPASEPVWRLDRICHAWRAPFDTPSVRLPPSLPDRPITFGSFNNPGKLSVETIALWSAVLTAVPTARLYLKGRHLDQAWIADDIRRRFARHGITTDRLRLDGERPDFHAHLDAYGDIDIALDPTPYNGTTTTCEALWMGVPVITLVGLARVARVGYSLVNAIGLPELAAPTDAAYIATAVDLAADRRRLTDWRLTLRGRMAASPLRDEAGYAAALDRAWRDLWRQAINR